MPFEHKDNSGTLFPNDRKTANNQPDFKGQIKVNGKLLDIAGWIKEGTKGNFYSLSVSEPRQQNAGQAQSGQGRMVKAGARRDDFDKHLSQEMF
jgi:uncharacterized protein (DUF736 family)